MATAAARRTTEDPDPTPVIAGQPPHRKVGWLPSDIGVDWFDDLANRHHASAREFAFAVDRLGNELDAKGDEQVKHRRAVREAIANGTAPPPAIDPEVVAARISIAEEDVELAQVELDELAIEVLAVSRERRAELVGHLSRLGDAFLASLLVGGGDRTGRAAIVAEQSMRAQRRMDRLRSWSENIDTDDQAVDRVEEVVGRVSR